MKRIAEASTSELDLVSDRTDAITGQVGTSPKSCSIPAKSIAPSGCRPKYLWKRGTGSRPHSARARHRPTRPAARPSGRYRTGQAAAGAIEAYRSRWNVTGEPTIGPEPTDPEQQGPLAHHGRHRGGSRIAERRENARERVRTGGPGVALGGHAAGRYGKTRTGRRSRFERRR
jgi:hypothetical protein